MKPHQLSNTTCIITLCQYVQYYMCHTPCPVLHVSPHQLSIMSSTTCHHTSCPILHHVSPHHVQNSLTTPAVHHAQYYMSPHQLYSTTCHHTSCPILHVLPHQLSVMSNTTCIIIPPDQYIQYYICHHSSCPVCQYYKFHLASCPTCPIPRVSSDKLSCST